MKNIDSDLIRGNIDTIILTTMLDGDKYGLDIIKEVEIRSNGTYELKQPTLYSCLKRLENQELISSYWLDSDIGGRRHYYKLTEKGKESLLQKQEEWAKSKFIIDNLLSNHDYDEYRLVKKEDYDKIIEGKQFDYKPEQSSPSTTVESEENDFVNEEDVDVVENVEDVDLDEIDEVEETEDVEDEDIDLYDNEESSEENEEYQLVENPSPVETHIDYNDDSDDAEADYPNQKRFKIPSIYDKITINDSENDLDETEKDEEDDFTSSIYSSFENAEDETEETEDFSEEIDIDGIEELEDCQGDEYIFGDSEDSINEDDDHVYVRSYESVEEAEDEDDDLDIQAIPPVDQSQNELNILSRLRMQDDEEINEYHGDKNSYINHLNQNNEIETLKSDDLNVVQEDLLSNDDYLSQSYIDNQINEFASAINELNNFNTVSFENEETEENFDEDTEIEDELITSSNEHEDAQDVIEFKEVVDDDDYLSELDELKQTKNNGFFNSLDSADYSQIKQEPNFEPLSFDTNDYSETDSSDAAFEKQVEDYHSQYGYNESNHSYEEPFNKTVENNDFETTEFSSFDDIISRNVTDYTNDATTSATNEQFASFTPRYTENNYKQKLNDLSAYSKINTEEKSTEAYEPNEDVMSKVKDIQTLRAEFEDEGICVKEYKKSNGVSDLDRTYLLTNKLNLVKSLILLFGYVFILSAIYIIMNNTSAQTIHNFSFKYFLYGFIPFGIYALYHTAMFVINPYKKVPAKYAPRIMIFISVIITIQLLLITYCVNLQLGFYSFSQEFYNHLIWVIPTIISFAPIVSNLIHLALYQSKNFHV